MRHKDYSRIGHSTRCPEFLGKIPSDTSGQWNHRDAVSMMGFVCLLRQSRDLEICELKSMPLLSLGGIKDFFLMARTKITSDGPKLTQSLVGIFLAKERRMLGMR